MPFVAPARSRPSWPHMHALRGPAVAVHGPFAVLRGPAAALSGPALALRGPIYACPSWPPLICARRGRMCIPLRGPAVALCGPFA
eukprot:6329561-Pyramimonas_sp.AAC.1